MGGQKRRSWSERGAELSVQTGAWWVGSDWGGKRSQCCVLSPLTPSAGGSREKSLGREQGFDREPGIVLGMRRRLCLCPPSPEWSCDRSGCFPDIPGVIPDEE